MCSSEIDYVYNPFRKLNYTEKCDCDDDKFYGLELNDIVDDITKISDVLENCKSYNNLTDLDNSIRTLTPNGAGDSISDRFSTLFLNLDGNKSNFDMLAVDIRRLKYNFSVIGLAETNTDPSNKNLYPLDNYNSFYQDPYPNKTKGTGVAMYVHTSIKATVNVSLSHISPNIETLFLNITLDKQTVTVGTIYRPPSGNCNTFLEEFRHILENCPKKNLYIMGDFNIDLHALADD